MRKAVWLGSSSQNGLAAAGTLIDHLFVFFVEIVHVSRVSPTARQTLGSNRASIGVEFVGEGFSVLDRRVPGAMYTLKKPGVLLFVIFATVISISSAEVITTNASTNEALNLSSEPASGVWDAGMGEGFRSTTQTFSIQAGALKGLAVFGSTQAHDLALTSVSYGHMLGYTIGQGCFYRGNLELRGELFGGVQFSPSSEWVIGLTPHLRYNFATGTRFVPYIDGGAGVTATSIGLPDLSNTFEFNLQATVGTQLFLRDNLALTLEARLLHMSCAGISQPNLGLNGILGMIGLTFVF